MTAWSGEIKCPECGHWQIPMNFCPNCGLKFDTGWSTYPAFGQTVRIVPEGAFCGICKQYHPIDAPHYGTYTDSVTVK